MNNYSIINLVCMFMFVELLFSLFALLRYSFSRSSLMVTRGRPLVWWEPWSYHTYNINFVSSSNPWDLYTKYRLSIWTNWHILEDRICLFALYIYILLL